MNGLAALVVSRFHPVMSEPIRIPPPDIGLKRERALKRAGFTCVAGLDEVGRGPLAGPVVSAAVVLDLKRVPAGLADSKALAPEQREALFDEILATAHVGIASISHADVDSINIRQASLLAMCRALAALALHARHGARRRQRSAEPALPGRSDHQGRRVHRVDRRRLHRRQGGARPPDGAAGRDLPGLRLCAPMPATARRSHLSALASEGPCPFHRMSFSPLRQGLLDL